ncbi:2588_t:CDS:2, partial [Funneliformis caledonium]
GSYNDFTVTAELVTFNMPGTIIVNHLPKNLSLNLKLPKRIDEQSKVKVEVLFGVTKITLKVFNTFPTRILTVE